MPHRAQPWAAVRGKTDDAGYPAAPAEAASTPEELRPRHADIWADDVGHEQEPQPEPVVLAAIEEEPHQGASAEASPGLNRVLRESHAAQSAAAGYWCGQGALGFKSGVDVDYFRDQEGAQLQAVERLMPLYRTKPSMLTGALGYASYALGLAAAISPPHINLAVSGALQDALQEHYNDQLRELSDSEGGAREAPNVRQVLVALRDTEHAPQGAPSAPDLLTLQRLERLEDLGISGVVGAVVKAATRVVLSGAGRV